MEKFPGRGYESITAEKSIYIGNLPGRKQVCLYVVDAGILDVLAYFKTHEKAQQALNWLDTLSEAEWAA